MSKNPQFVHRKCDVCSGHGCWPPRPLITGSKNVYVNNRQMGRMTDLYPDHCCIDCHPGAVADGSKVTYANNLRVARHSDPVTCGSTCMEHSPNVKSG